MFWKKNRKKTKQFFVLKEIENKTQKKQNFEFVIQFFCF